jgi:group I intron endonuclease
VRLNLGEHANAGGVYRITCLVNGWVYIGQAKCFRARALRHERRTHNAALAAAMREHGSDAFEMTVLAVIADPNERTREELRLIRQVYGPGCYNAIYRRTPNMTGRKHEPETIERMRVAQLGRKHEPETIEKLRAANAGKRCSPEHIERLRGMKRSAETVEKIRAARLGTKRSPETIEKLRAAGLGRKQSPEAIEKCRAAATRRHALRRAASAALEAA